MPRIRPLRNYVGIRKVSDRETRGGLILPDKVDSYRYVIEEIGPDVTEVKPGDEVVPNPAVPAISHAADEGIMLTSVHNLVAIVDRKSD